MTRYDVLPSAFGPIVLRAESDALTGVWFSDDPDPTVPRDAGGPLRTAREQLEAYFGGERTAFDLPLAPAGSPFQRAVWAALTEIPYGTTTTYGALATGLGRPSAMRAVGAANGRNPLAIVVPCHRVIGASGKLVGYAAGLERKHALLALEGATLI